MSTRKFPYAMETRVSGEICSLAQEEEAEISGWPLTVTHITKNNVRHEKVIFNFPQFFLWDLIPFWSVEIHQLKMAHLFFAFNILHLFILFALEKKKIWHASVWLMKRVSCYLVLWPSFDINRHRLFLAVALLLAKCWSSTYPLLDTNGRTIL